MHVPLCWHLTLVSHALLPCPVGAWQIDRGLNPLRQPGRTRHATPLCCPSFPEHFRSSRSRARIGLTRVQGVFSASQPCWGVRTHPCELPSPSPAPGCACKYVYRVIRPRQRVEKLSEPE